MWQVHTKLSQENPNIDYHWVSLNEAFCLYLVEVT